MSTGSQSTYQRLVDRYIDVTRWPTSKKTALVMVFAIPFHLVAWSLVRFSGGGLGAVLDVPRVAAANAVWLAAVVLLALLALPFARRGREARWTIYLTILFYGSCSVWVMYLLGTIGPFLFFLPLVVLLLTLFVDSRAGLAAFVFAAGLIGAAVGLELSGHLAHAPALKARSLDALLTPAWVSLVSAIVLLASSAVLILLQLADSARLAQQGRLQEARDELATANERLERSTGLIRRYVPTQLAERILAGEHTEGARPERRKLTLFFSDVVEFTAASDRMDPEDLSALLNEYLSEMAAVADSAGATVNQFVGDGIMIFFGAPEATSDRDHALRAVRMALAMQRRMAELRERWFEEGVETPFRIRIGINTGVASVGDFGSEGRTTYSAIGKQTNLAARIQDHCEPGKVLISHTTFGLVKDDIPCEPRGEIEVKGLHYPVRVYEVMEDGDA
jgi:class 3 adenylate cyclase